MKYAASFIPKTLLARIALAVFVLALGITAIITFFIPSPEKRMAQAIEAKIPLTGDQKKLLAARLDIMSGDADNDGLKDWEELIYKTDLKNPDTDGDGTSDGEEIKQNRNPLVKAKNDSLQATSESANDPAFNESGYTATLMSALLSNPAFLKILTGDTENMTEEEARQLAEQFADSSDFAAIDAVDEAALYAKVVSSDDTSPAAIKKYFNTLGAIYEKYLFVMTPEEDPYVVIAETIKNNDLSKLAVLAGHKKRVEGAAGELEKISPPTNVADFHKKEIVVLEKTVKQLAALAGAEKDPLIVMVVLPRYIKLRQNAEALHTDMQDWLVNHGIHFAEQEPGSFFNKS